MDEIRSWVEDSPYSKFLGVRLDHLDEKSARLILPYQDENSNPGKALHGGCAASLGAIGGQAVARAALGSGVRLLAHGPDAGELPGRRDRRGRDRRSRVAASRQGALLRLDRRERPKRESRSRASHDRARSHGRGARTETVASAGDHGESDPGPMGPHIGKVPFIGNRGIASST